MCLASPRPGDVAQGAEQSRPATQGEETCLPAPEQLAGSLVATKSHPYFGFHFHVRAHV